MNWATSWPGLFVVEAVAVLAFGLTGELGYRLGRRARK